MTDPYRKYAQVAAHAPNDHRSLESAALINMAHEMDAAIADWPTKAGHLDAALERNRTLWAFFFTESSENTTIDDGLRQNIANLALFIFKRTLAMQGAPTPEGVKALININRTLAIGLSRE